MKCAWKSSDSVVMEVTINGRASDSEPCSRRQMMLELEEAGLVDASINGHNCAHPPAASEGISV